MLVALANACRKSYRDDARMTAPALLDLLKEKKVTVSQPVNQCLDTYFDFCLGTMLCLCVCVRACARVCLCGYDD